MSSDAAAASAPVPEASPTVEDAARASESAGLHRAALRIGFGLAIAFALAELFAVPAFFMPPLVAVQLLAQMRQPPGIRQAIALLALTGALCGFTLFVAAALSPHPLIYGLILGLVLFLGFYLDSAGKAMAGGLLLILTATIPLVAVQSMGAASGLAATLFESVFIAILATWVAFAIFPTPTDAESPAATRPPSARLALANTLLLLPPLLLFLIEGQMSFVLIIVIVSILRQAERANVTRTALALTLANLLGGAAATIAYGFVTVLPSFLFFLLLVLLVGLMFGERIARRDAVAPLYLTGLVTFVILLGLGVSPLPTDTSTAFADRLVSVMLAGLYAVGALSLISFGHKPPPRPLAADAAPESG